MRVRFVLMAIPFLFGSAHTAVGQTWEYSKRECNDFVAQVAYSKTLAKVCYLSLREKTLDVEAKCIEKLTSTKVKQVQQNGLTFARNFLKRNEGAQMCQAIRKEIGPMLAR